MIFAASRLAPCKLRGFTLVELMIAVTISLILLAGVTQIFISNKQTYRMNDALSRLQENARYAMHVLTSDLRMAGFVGCMDSTDPSKFESTLNTPNAYQFDFNNLLQGYEATGTNTWSPALDASFSAGVLTGTDVVAIKHMDGNGVAIAEKKLTATGQIHVEPTSAFSEGDVIMLADCEKASVFQVTNMQSTAGGTRINVVHGNSAGYSPGNSTPQINNNFDLDAKLARLVSTVYYIGTGASGQPALFRRTLNRTGSTAVAFQAEELIEGVENMQLLYGERTGGTTRFVAANSVADMDAVVAIRLALLMKTTDTAATSVDTRTYDLAGTTIDPANEAVIRRVMTTTINIRNRGL